MSKRLYREFYLLPRAEQRALLLLSLLLIFSLFFRITVQLLPGREPEGMEEFEQEARMIMATFARADTLQRVRSDSIRRKETGNSGHAIPYIYPGKTGDSAYPIDINRADSAQLLPLPGIGPVYAGRIIKYRNLLGGFVRVDQLLEVYGLSEETMGLIRDKICTDTSAIRKIRLDSASFRELLRHPYLELADVKAMVEYRDFKGTIQSSRELLDNSILPDSLLQRVLPYLEL
ncbi:MAG: helix-hairpin-helix domain-containing protein [Bacteroidales bacterium]|nr:helix-hairpin-helix domain-containing protein [Bacteroidales bacterium]